MSIAEPTIRRWTREEYYRMADMGMFEGQRVELIEGEIIQMAPQKDVHAACVGLAVRQLTGVFGSGFWVRCQLPITLGDESEPEPDVSVVPGDPRDFVGTGHPKRPLLVVEVSDSTLRFDRKRKASLYAAAMIEDYWIVNLIDRVVEVHRQPRVDGNDPRGGRYDSIQTVGAGETIASLAKPDASIQVSDLLP